MNITTSYIQLECTFNCIHSIYSIYSHATPTLPHNKNVDRYIPFPSLICTHLIPNRISSDDCRFGNQGRVSRITNETFHITVSFVPAPLLPSPYMWSLTTGFYNLQVLILMIICGNCHHCAWIFPRKRLCPFAQFIKRQTSYSPHSCISSGPKLAPARESGRLRTARWVISIECECPS